MKTTQNLTKKINYIGYSGHSVPLFRSIVYQLQFSHTYGKIA